MTEVGKVILNVIVLVAATASISAAIENSVTARFPSRVYACDFRLISAATCALPMAAHTIRVTHTHADADRAKRKACGERIVACEHEKTAKRRIGEPVSLRKCWDERLTSLAKIARR